MHNTRAKLWASASIPSCAGVGASDGSRFVGWLEAQLQGSVERSNLELDFGRYKLATLGWSGPARCQSLMPSHEALDTFTTSPGIGVLTTTPRKRHDELPTRLKTECWRAIRCKGGKSRLDYRATWRAQGQLPNPRRLLEILRSLASREPQGPDTLS